MVVGANLTQRSVQLVQMPLGIVLLEQSAELHYLLAANSPLLHHCQKLLVRVFDNCLELAGHYLVAPLVLLQLLDHVLLPLHDGVVESLVSFHSI